jgi:hypothetical protein
MAYSQRATRETALSLQISIGKCSPLRVYFTMYVKVDLQYDDVSVTSGAGVLQRRRQESDTGPSGAKA